jgi:hypothetical protein
MGILREMFLFFEHSILFRGREASYLGGSLAAKHAGDLVLEIITFCAAAGRSSKLQRLQCIICPAEQRAQGCMQILTLPCIRDYIESSCLRRIFYITRL